MEDPKISTTEKRKVSPKKLPAGLGWGVLAPHDAVAGEVVEVVTKRGKTWESTLVEEIQYGVWSTDTTEAATGTTRERLENRLEQREDWAEGRERKGSESWEASRKAVEGIPLGQPILVGHHSEARHRKAVKTSHDKASQAVEHFNMAQKHGQAADTIERNLARSIYDDDVDAVEALTERVQTLEAQRERIKDINRRIRKGESLDSMELTSGEKADLLAAAQFNGTKGYPSYHLQNLGGNIKRNRDRLAKIKRFQGIE